MKIHNKAKNMGFWLIYKYLGSSDSFLRRSDSDSFLDLESNDFSLFDDLPTGKGFVLSSNCFDTDGSDFWVAEEVAGVAGGAAAAMAEILAVDDSCKSFSFSRRLIGPEGTVIT